MNAYLTHPNIERAKIHFNQGAALQQLHRLEEALGEYRKAISLRPGYMEAHFNRGIVLQEMGRLEEAAASYRKAVDLSPNMVQLYNNLGNTLHALGLDEEALAVYDRALSLKPDFLEILYNRAFSLEALGRFSDAAESYLSAVAVRPFTEGYLNLGNVLIRMEMHAEALVALDQSIALQPENALAHQSRGNALIALKQPEEALLAFDRALAIDPNLATAHYNRGNTLRELKRFDEAASSYEQAIILNPESPEAFQNLGIVLAAKGAMEEASKMYGRALRLQPTFSRSWLSMARIRRYVDPNDPDIRAMEKCLHDPSLEIADRELLHFALGKVYDDCEAYDLAFEHVQKANTLAGQSVRYQANAVIASVNRVVEAFGEDFLKQGCPGASEDAGPVFVVGMPRSGTTLLAQMLSQHDSIESAGELSTLTDLSLEIPGLLGLGEVYPQAFRSMNAEVALRISSRYLTSLRENSNGAPLVIDKHPMNYWHLGMISMLFPKARIIHCRRDPRDVGLSTYFQKFDSEYAYSFGLESIAHYITESERLMRHWREALPRPMIEVDYEALAMEPKETISQILSDLELPWDPRCLNPEQNTNVVETASDWQARQPIYSRSIGRWRNYEPFLRPMLRGLRPR